MSIGAIIAGLFAIVFTLGALVLPFAMRKWIDTVPLSPLRRLGAALYALFGTMGLTLFAVLSTMVAYAYVGIVGESTFWITFLCQTVAIGGNLFFWFSRMTQAPN